jgi:hypothetical protein
MARAERESERTLESREAKRRVSAFVAEHELQRSRAKSACAVV